MILSIDGADQSQEGEKIQKTVKNNKNARPTLREIP
jgi:hypothetical protein